ncbi:COG1470 family protein [Streptomyces syringium]|uniref:COG1470 family protein n=1 Tax=Streptomyces syringium TaxID=76729 RepID=UPI0033EDB83B
MPSRTTFRTRAVVLATALCALSAAPAAADTRPWTAAPAPGGTRGPGAEDRSSFFLEGGPGTVIEDRLTVVNPGDRARTVALRGTGPWIALAERRVKVPPRTRADVPLTVTVPAGTAPGDHHAAVVATGDGRRVRVPMAVRVSGSALPALTVEHVRVSGTGGSAVIRYALVNRGNTTLAPRLTIRAKGHFGEVLNRVARDAPAALAPGGSVRLAEKWPGAPRLDPVEVRITAQAPGAAPATASGSYTPLPWLVPTVLAGLGLAGAGAAGRLLVRRRGRRGAGATA